jgi:hypothetical protein
MTKSFNNKFRLLLIAFNLLVIAVLIKCDALISSAQTNYVLSFLFTVTMLGFLCHEVYAVFTYKEAWAATYTGLDTYDLVFLISVSFQLLNFYISALALAFLIFNYFKFLMRDFIAEECYQGLHFSISGIPDKVYKLSDFYEEKKLVN